MDYVVVAKVVSTHGIKGDLKLFPLTDFAKVRFKKGKVFELYPFGNGEPWKAFKASK